MVEKDKIEKKVNEGYTIRELGKFFDLSYSAVRYILKKYNLNTRGYKIINNWNKDDLLEAIKKSNCKSDVLRHLDIKIKSGNFQTLERYCLLYKIDISHLKYNNDRGFKYKQKITDEELFVVNSKHTGSTVRKRIKAKKIFEYKCEKCSNNGEWNGEKLSLQLDHKNGVNNDHRLENLRWLCPNCHSQTTTFNRKKED